MSNERKPKPTTLAERTAAKVTPRSLIDGVPPWEYSTHWGDGATRDGCLMYSACHIDRWGRPGPNPEWSAETWGEYIGAIGRLRGGIVERLRRAGKQVPAALGTLTGAREGDWKDLDDLLRLERWAVYCLQVVQNGGTWQSRV